MALPPEARPEVGYIPAGTTNDFSRNLSLPRGMEAMARTAAAGVPRPVDIGRFNGEHFIYVAAFGAFTDVSYNTPQPVKNLLGRTAYMLESVNPHRLHPVLPPHRGARRRGGGGGLLLRHGEQHRVRGGLQGDARPAGGPGRRDF